MTDPTNEFEREAQKERTSFVGDLWAWVSGDGKWWLMPILIAALVLSVFLVLSATPVGPYIYSLF